MDNSYLPTGGKFVESGSEYQMTCPSCGHGNFFWNLKKMVGNCFNCELKVLGSGQFSRVFRTHVPEAKPRTGLPAERAERERLIPITDPAALEALIYLNARDCDYGLAQEVGICYSPAQRRVYCPIWSPLSKQPPSWKSRSILPGYKGWMGEPGDRGRHYLFGKAPEAPLAVLVEGVFDVLTPGMWGTAISLLGSSLSREIEYWLCEKYSRVVLWLDPDNAGVTKSRAMADRIHSWGIPVTNLSGSHPEPGSVTAEYAHETLARFR